MVLVLLGLMLPFTLEQGGYLETVLVLICLYGVLATSTDLLMGRLGLPSMANGALLAVGAYTLAISTSKYEWGFWTSFLIAILVSSAVGLLLGIVTMRSNGHYFAISSVAFAGAIVVVITAWPDMTGGAAGIFGIGRPDDLTIGGFTVRLGSTRGQYFTAFLLLLAVPVLAGAITSAPLRGVMADVFTMRGLGKWPV
jgi:branched-chain amino acid transport system permease protein